MKNRISCVTLALIVSMATACANIQVSGTADINSVGGPIAESSPIITIVENSDIKNVDDNKDTVNEDTESDNINDNDSKISENADENGSTETDTANDEDKQDSENKADGPFIEDFEITATQGEMVVVKNAVVRKGPSTDFAKLGTLTIGDVVELTGESTNGWYRFKYDSGEGFTFQKFLIDKETYDKEKSEDTEEAITGKSEVSENSNNSEDSEKASDSEDTVTTGGTEDYNLFTDRVIELCNEKRAEYGLDPLTTDIVLDEKAEIRAEEITRRFEHKRPDGSEFTAMLSDVTWSACGENIAAGQSTPEEVVEAWMNSYGHRSNILNPSFAKIGVGYISGGEYGNYWVQIFTD